MNIYDYQTSGGKNVIIDYIMKLPKDEKLEILAIRKEIRNSGIEVFQKLNTRQLRGKLWEIKISQTRIMYVIVDSDSVCFFHICKKQKGKAEKQEIEKALKRAREEKVLR